MKFTIDRSAFLKALAHSQGVVERRNTIPILSNVLLKATSGVLTLTASDMEIELVETVPADVAEVGAVTAPAAMLYDIVRKLPDGAEVEINCPKGKDQVAIRAGRAHFKLGSLPMDDFPQMVCDDVLCEVSLGADSLIHLLDRTKFAMAAEETRYYLNGVFMHATTSGGASVLRAVATDGHRLARMEVPLPAGGEAMPAVILPRKSVGEMRKLLDEGVRDVTLAMSESKVRLTVGNVVLTTKLIDARYPDYTRVIPSGNDKTMLASSKILADAVDRVATVSSDKTRTIKLVADHGVLRLSANSADAGGAAEEEIEVSYDQDMVDIGFNSRYLHEIVQQIDGETVEIKMADGGAPIIVSAAGDSAALYVLMPMRV